MALIRQPQAQRITHDAVVLDLGDLARQGDACREHARADAVAIVREAHLERRRLLDGAAAEGLAKGHAEGLEQGRTQGRQEGHAAALAESAATLNALQSRWTEALGTFEAARAQMLTDARRDLVQLALEIARRVIKRSIEQDPAIVIGQLDAVLAVVTRPTRLRVRIHPLDEETVQGALPLLLERFKLVEHAEVTTDASLSRGSCVAATVGGGEMDASIGTQLDRIAAALLPEHGSGNLPTITAEGAS